MARRNVGEIIVWMGALLPVALWLLTSAAEPQGRQAHMVPFLGDIGQIAGLVGMAMLGIAFVLASRARFLENLFGGLDKMYRVHHRLGRTAFVLLLVHPVAHAFRFVPDRLEKALLFFLPTHRELAVDLGVYAFWAFLLLMVLTLFVNIAYDKWKVSHKLLGAVLIVGAVHMFTVPDTPGRSVALTANPVLMSYMAVLTVIAVAAFAYKVVVLPLVSRRNICSVSAVERLNDQVLRIELSPRDRRLDFEPGQFVFVSFDQPGLPREAHPFTICSVPGNGSIVVTVKALGDFTDALHRRLHAGARAWIEGPYGRFDYRSGSCEQIWLGAGVGIAPFLSWARYMEHFEDRSHGAKLYYCVRNRSDAIHFEEFRRMAERLTNLDVTLVCSANQGHVRAVDLGELRNKDVFMCGPKHFTSDLKAQFLKLGVPDHRIHFEDFEFR